MTQGTAPVTDFNLTVTLSDKSGITDDAVANRELVLKAYLALETGQPDALVDIVHPEVVFYEAASLPYGGARNGVAKALEGVRDMMAAWRTIDVSVEEFACAGDLVIAYMTFRGVSRATGREYTGPCAEMFRMRENRIIEWRPIYWDTHAAIAALDASNGTNI